MSINRKYLTRQLAKVGKGFEARKPLYRERERLLLLVETGELGRDEALSELQAIDALVWQSLKNEPLLVRPSEARTLFWDIVADRA